MKNTKTYSSALSVERSGEAERSEAVPTVVGVGRPNPEVVARAKRRIFTGEYKQRVLAAAYGTPALHDGPGAAILMAAVNELSPTVGTQAVCEVLGLLRASYYRRQSPTFGPSKKAVSARALSLTERDTVLACLHEERFQDRSPAAVFATAAG